MSPLGNVQAKSNVEVADSCNCTYCCPRNCCLPIGRKTKPIQCRNTEGDIEIQTTTVKVQGASQAHLTKSGKWDIEIDGKRFSKEGEEVNAE